MKIGIVLSTTPAYSETFFLSKIKGLLASGFDVTLFVQKAHPDFDLCPVCMVSKVYKTNPIFQLFAMPYVLLGFLIGFPKRFFKFITYERQAHRTWVQIAKNLYTNSHILKANLDWLHFGFATMALQSEHVAKAIGAKMAVSFRGYDIDVYPLKHEGCYQLLWEHVDRVHSISQYLLNKAHAMGLPKTTPYQIITPAIDLNKFNAVTSKIHHPLQLLTIARLEWIKGLSYTIEALALLKQQGIDFRYTIIGAGSMKDELLYSILQLGLADWVSIVDRIPHEDIKGHLQNTDIYIQYSLSEGFCNAVLEAQAMGCLCVVSDGGALPENVLDGQTGCVVPKKDPAKLSKKILEVLQLSENEKMTIRAVAQNRVRQAFNLEKQQKEFANFYRE